MAAATTARMSRVRRTERLHFAAGLRLPSACRSSGTRTSCSYRGSRVAGTTAFQRPVCGRDRSGRGVQRLIRRLLDQPLRAVAAATSPVRTRWSRSGRTSFARPTRFVGSTDGRCLWCQRHNNSPLASPTRPSNQPLSLRATGWAEAARDSARVPNPWLDGIPSSGSRGWLSLRPLQHRPRQPTTPSRQGAARRRGRRFMHALRLRPVFGRAAVPPPRAARETVSHLGGRAHAFPGSASRRGRKVLATLRQLPRGGGSWHNGLATAAAQHRSGVAQW